MERRSGRTSAAVSDHEDMNRGIRSVGLCRRFGRGIAELFMWLCMLIPVALFILFMPRLAGMLSMGQASTPGGWTAVAPNSGAAAETSEVVLAAAAR